MKIGIKKKSYFIILLLDSVRGELERVLTVIKHTYLVGCM